MSAACLCCGAEVSAGRRYCGRGCRDAGRPYDLADRWVRPDSPLTYGRRCDGCGRLFRAAHHWRVCAPCHDARKEADQ